jgi:ankyrin repeat protein
LLQIVSYSKQELNSALLHAVQSNSNISNIRTLLQYGADVNAQNGQALILSIRNDQPVLTTYLIDKGANVHADEDEALKRALLKKDDSDHRAKKLIEAGANIHAQGGLLTQAGRSDLKIYVSPQMLGYSIIES